jgi:hypothetical protein
MGRMKTKRNRTYIEGYEITRIRERITGEKENGF